MTTARYDGLAEWYDREFANDGPARQAVLCLLGAGNGRLLDVGCGSGAHTAAIAERGWEVVGVDISEDLLERARKRGIDVINADATAVPFPDASFDAVVSMWTHTDVDDFGAVTCEVSRVLRRDGIFVYLGAHPCFVGPHSLYEGAIGVPQLHAGQYRRSGRYTNAPGVSASGLRAKVGATHVPLASFIHAFVDAGFRIDHFEEPEAESRDFPYMIAIRARP